MPISNLCQVKTAYMINEDEHPSIVDMICDHPDEFWASVGQQFMGPPWGWQLKETDSSGARMVLVFETEQIPHYQGFMWLSEAVDIMENRMGLELAIMRLNAHGEEEE